MIISVRDGVTPHIGDNGNWFLDTDDTGINARGLSGSQLRSITLVATDWDENLTQSVYVEGIIEDDLKQMVDIVPASMSSVAYSAHQIECYESSTNTLVFKTNSIPQIDISIYVIINNTTEELIKDVYSTEETVVGTWIDGRPIYRTCLVDVLPTTADVTDIRSNVPWKDKNMDNLVNIYGSIYGSSNYPTIKASIFDNTLMRLWITPTSMCVIVKADYAPYLGRPFYLTVEYTKTTDTATIAIPSATALMDAYDEGVNDA